MQIELSTEEIGLLKLAIRRASVSYQKEIKQIESESPAALQSEVEHLKDIDFKSWEIFNRFVDMTVKV